jgi:hypothetical protein
LKVIDMGEGEGIIGSRRKRYARPVMTILQGFVLALPLGGCWLTGKPPEPGLAIPAAYRFGAHFPSWTGGVRSIRAS